MFITGIKFKEFNTKKKKFLIKKKLEKILLKKNPVIDTLGKKYKNNYDKKILLKYKRLSNFRIIGMGGSILGTKAIYQFLKHKIKKNFTFIDNLHHKQFNKKKIF